MVSDTASGCKSIGKSSTEDYQTCYWPQKYVVWWKCAFFGTSFVRINSFWNRHDHNVKILPNLITALDEAGLRLCNSVTQGSGLRLIPPVTVHNWSQTYLCLESLMNGICYSLKLLQAHHCFYLRKTKILAWDSWLCFLLDV